MESLGADAQATLAALHTAIQSPTNGRDLSRP
jgi:hypothetical protein